MANMYEVFVRKHMFLVVLCSSLLSLGVLADDFANNPLAGAGNADRPLDHHGIPPPGNREVLPPLQNADFSPKGRVKSHDPPDVPKKQMKLAEQPECADDVAKFCGKLPLSSGNFAVMDCLQSDKRKDEEVSLACQHLVWSYKKNLTTDFRFDSAVTGVCEKTLQKDRECSDEMVKKQGKAIPCLIEHIDNITDANCRAFLKRMKTIVFSDYRLVYKFVDGCDGDIKRLKCGRLPNDEQREAARLPHEQGRTLRCVLEKFDELAPECRRQVLRVAELQADDYHSDRQLFYACREDRETFCGQVKAGDGRVYKCLYRHKFDREFSEECRKLLTTRQKIEQRDFRVNFRLARSCQKDIAAHHCEQDMKQVADFKYAQMSAILLCLEGAIKDDEAKLEPECLTEMHDVRRSLMEDFQINPLLVANCSTEIERHCNAKLRRNGRTIHCLMDLARRKEAVAVSDDPRSVHMGDQCARALEFVLTEADVGESYDVDPVLREECDPVVKVLCANVRPGEGRVINCLLSSFENRLMNEHPHCKESLTEVFYFISRDFRLDTRLYKQCHSEAQRLCSAPSEWHRTGAAKDSTAPSMGPLVLSCLFRRIARVGDDDDADADDNRHVMHNRKEVSRQCAYEVRRVIRDRALAVDLDPIVERDCMHDLAVHCSGADKKGKSQEMDCLEDNFIKLTKECKNTLKEYVEEVDEEPEMDELFAEACAPFWEKHCQHVMSKEEDDDDDDGKKRNDADENASDDASDEGIADSLMQCLIQFKHHHDMDDKCRAGVEHHQLITLKDYHFSHQFKQACHHDIRTNCNNATEKPAVIQCLSEIVRSDALTDSKPRVTKHCRKQLKFELLQRSENIKLDPDLESACAEDVQTNCANVSPGKAAITECLRKHQETLRPKCHELIFKREQEEARDPNIDYLLVSKCKSMIKKYCAEEISSPAEIFSCLRRNKDEDTFDRMCRKTILLREELRAKDIRLNPKLHQHCSEDARKLCREEMASLTEKESEGKVILCLRRAYVHKKLSPPCEDYIHVLLKESAKDYKQDIPLAKACVREIDEHCSEQKELNGDADNGRVEQCLKEHVLSKQITLEHNRPCYIQVSRVLEENRFDVQSDVALYKACVNELKDHCDDVPSGEGRKIGCLMAVYNRKPHDLADGCRRRLEQRIKLFNLIVTMKPLESVGEFAALAASSPTKNSLLAYLLGFIAVIFVVGLLFGRVTKRVRREIKNR